MPSVDKHSTWDELLVICPKLASVGSICEPASNDSVANFPLLIASETNQPLKSDMGSMYFPFFSLRPELQDDREWRLGDKSINFKFGCDGSPGWMERDLWIFGTSQLMAVRNNGQIVSPRIRFRACHFFRVTGWGRDGRSYQRLRKALRRLHETTVETNVLVGNKMIQGPWRLIESYLFDEGRGDSFIEVVLPNWLVESVNQKRVLTLDSSYFELKPFSRAIYLIARLRCGNQKKWKVELDKLRIRSASTASLKEFSRALRGLSESDVLPGYKMVVDGKYAIFTSK